GPALVRLLDPESRRERLERPRSCKRPRRAGRLLAIMRLRVPGDVLTEPLLAGAGEPHERRYALEVAGHACLEPLERVALDLERKLGDPCIHLRGRLIQTSDPTEEESPGVRGSHQRSFRGGVRFALLVAVSVPTLVVRVVVVRSGAVLPAIPFPLGRGAVRTALALALAVGLGTVRSTLARGLSAIRTALPLARALGAVRSALALDLGVVLGGVG